MNKLLFTILLLVFTVAMSATVYRWVENDTVHFSDQPVEGAEKLEIPEMDTIPPPVPAEPDIHEQPPVAEDAPPIEYSRLTIVTPEHNSVVWVTGGLMQVVLDVEPELQPGDMIKLLLNDKPVEGSPAASKIISATGIIRGTHQLIAAIIDADGNELLRSEPVVIHARAHSVHDRLRQR